jgi:hypothetical protein
MKEGELLQGTTSHGKFIQITAAPVDESVSSYPNLFALDNDGQVWQFNYQWTEYKDMEATVHPAYWKRLGMGREEKT